MLEKAMQAPMRYLLYIHTVASRKGRQYVTFILATLQEPWGSFL